MLTVCPSPYQVLIHHLVAHLALNLDLVGGFQGDHRKANLLLGAVCVLCRTTPLEPCLAHHRSPVVGLTHSALVMEGWDTASHRHRHSHSHSGMQPGKQVQMSWPVLTEPV